ncbi:MAG: class II aldolase/adducin family protein [Clostridia bacterium]|nr:class II aldolase/adducin family protein [Clostridia bacterium]
MKDTAKSRYADKFTTSYTYTDFQGNTKTIKVDKNGNKIEGKLNPSSEIKMHMRVYQERPDVGAVVHAHPPVATAFTIAGIDLDQYILPEAILTIGEVPTCAYGTPSTMEIPDSLEPYIQNHDAFLLQNHGALTVGFNLMKAQFVMEEVEFNAKICKYAMELGAVHEIPNEQLKKLMDLRKKMNIPGRHPGLDLGEDKPASVDTEALVEKITRKVLEALNK